MTLIYYTQYKADDCQIEHYITQVKDIRKVNITLETSNVM